MLTRTVAASRATASTSRHLARSSPYICPRCQLEAQLSHPSKRRRTFHTSLNSGLAVSSENLQEFATSDAQDSSIPTLTSRESAILARLRHAAERGGTVAAAAQKEKENKKETKQETKKESETKSGRRRRPVARRTATGPRIVKELGGSRSRRRAVKTDDAALELEEAGVTLDNLAGNLSLKSALQSGGRLRRTDTAGGEVLRVKTGDVKLTRKLSVMFIGQYC